MSSLWSQLESHFFNMSSMPSQQQQVPNQNYQQQQQQQLPVHKGSITHEVVAGAAAFYAMREYEKKREAEGNHDHTWAREILAAIAAAKVDSEFETKGLDWLDRERAKRQAVSQAHQLYSEKYQGGGMMNQNQGGMMNQAMNPGLGSATGAGMGMGGGMMNQGQGYSNGPMMGGGQVEYPKHHHHHGGEFRENRDNQNWQGERGNMGYNQGGMMGNNNGMGMGQQGMGQQGMGQGMNQGGWNGQQQGMGMGNNNGMGYGQQPNMGMNQGNQMPQY